MWKLPNEDEYWEHVRENLENRKPDQNPDPETEWLFLDDEIEELEEEYGFPLSELYEGDLEEIVEKKTGVVPLCAKYDPMMYGIRYEYLEEAS